MRDQSLEIGGLKVWGSPWQPAFCDWAFNLPRDGPELQQVWQKIPEDTEILITHTPPHGILDQVDGSGPGGCERLLERILTLPNLKLHVFGHIHGGYGTLSRGMTTFVNASICDESYRPIRQPFIVDLK